MDKRTGALAVLGGLLIAGGVIGWLFIGSKPIKIKVNDVDIKTSITLKNTVINRDKDGMKLWEFNVAEVEQDKQRNRAKLKGITGKVFRKDGSYIDISADEGETTLQKSNNDFMVKGKVQAILNTGGKFYADQVVYQEKNEFIQATGNVRIQKDEYAAYGDSAETTTAMEKFKLKGNARIEKGGKIDDK